MTKLLFPIGMFPIIMVIAATVFFPADWPSSLMRWCRVALARLMGSSFGVESTDALGRQSANPTPPQRVSNLALAIAGVYCAFQVLFPLRFLAYGGNVRWHEQGMRFSWRVMVREKNGSITYRVHHPATRRTWHVSPHRYLTPLQEREISGQPDLILQLAHHIRNDFEERGLGAVEVRVDALVSLNGRRSVRLIDPNLDLTKIHDGLAKYDWVLPAPTEAAPRIRPIGNSSAFADARL